MRIALLLVSALAPALLAQNYPYVITTLAGNNPLGDGGPATAALLEYPSTIGVDPGTGTVLFNDTINNRIRQVNTSGVISTFVRRTLADFKIDASGNLYGVDGEFQVIKITRAGVVSTIAGAGYGYIDNVPASQARFDVLSGIAVDAAGNIFLADTLNSRVRKIGLDGIVTTVAGNGLLGYSGDGNRADLARLAYPQSLAVDSAGNLYIGEAYDIRKVSPNGVITTIAGFGNSLADGALAINAPIGFKVGLALDSAGNLYIADAEQERVRVITGATIRTVAGRGTFGFTGDGGPAAAAELDEPVAVAVDAGGNLYIADSYNLRIRKVSGGTISTIAGRSHYGGDNGPATEALMHLPTQTVTDTNGNIFVSDTDNHRIRKITPAGTISTIAGTGRCAYSGDVGPAVSANICFPSQILLDPAGNLVFGDSGNRVVRRITPTGVITTIAGSGVFGDAGDAGPAAAAQFKSVSGIALDGQGNLYVSDGTSNKIRKISNGTVSTLAGNGSAGIDGDGGFATSARLNSPGLLAVDATGSLFVSDRGNRRIRKVAGGLMSTVVGISNCCFVGGKGFNTYIDRPGGIAVDAAGNLFLSLYNLGYVAKVTPAGDFSLIAGSPDATTLGDGGLATKGTVFGPQGLTIDRAGDLILTDSYNSRIRKLTLNSPTRLAIAGGDGQTGTTGSSLPLPLKVQLTFRAGVPVEGIEVTYAVTSGSATVTAARTTDRSERRGRNWGNAGQRAGPRRDHCIGRRTGAGSISSNGQCGSAAADDQFRRSGRCRRQRACGGPAFGRRIRDNLRIQFRSGRHLPPGAGIRFRRRASTHQPRRSLCPGRYSSRVPDAGHAGTDQFSGSRRRAGDHRQRAGSD
jgi:sugar lactone lactonase YvrE